MPDRKINFCSKYSDTVANADIGSLKFLHYIKMFVSHAIEIEQNRLVQTTKFWAFWQKKNCFFYTHFWQRVDAIMEDVSVAEIVV